MMKSGKGFFLTFMVFLLVGAVLALNVALQQSTVREQRSLIDEAALKEVNSRFNSVHSQILEDREGRAGDVQDRIIPKSGSYAVGGSLFSVTQEVPPSEVSVGVSDTFDALNLFSIFIGDEQISRGLEVESHITTGFNIEAWGGGGGENPEFGYLIQPFCLRYLAVQFGDRFMGYQIPGKTTDDWEDEKDDDSVPPDGTPDCVSGEYCYDWGCELPFDIENIESITVDLTVAAPTAECDLSNYLNGPDALKCQGSFAESGTTCRTACTNPSGETKEICITMNFNEDECQGECIVDGETVAANLTWGGVTNNNIEIEFDSPTGLKKTVLRFLSKNIPVVDYKVFMMAYDGRASCIVSTLNVTIEFTDDVGALQYAGFEFAVSKPNFDYCRRTAGASCPG